MSLDLGALVGSVILNTAQFDQAYTRTTVRMAELGTSTEKSAAGTASLDEAYLGAAASADKAAAAVGRTTTATRANVTAEERAALAATRHAEALGTVAGSMDRLALSTPRVQQADLRLIAAQERLNALQASGVATTRQLALAQANLIGAERGVVAAEEAAAVKTGFFTTALGRTLKMAGELGLVIGGIEIAKKAIEFVMAGKQLTDALNGVQAASKATDSQMIAVRAEAIALGKDLSIPAATAVDAAKAIEDLVRAGMTLPRALLAARPALLLASAAQVDMADAARFLGDTLDDFQLPADQATHVANALAGAATSAGGGLTDMFEAIKYAGPFARAAGVDVDSLVATVAELAKSGIQGSMAGTGIRMMLQKLAQDAPGTAKALKVLGVTAFDMKGQFVGLPKVLNELHDAQERLSQQDFLKAVANAFGARAATTVAALAHKGVEGYDEFLARVKSGDVQKYADIMNRGVGAGFRQLGKEATAAGIDVYQKLEPALTNAVMWLGTNLPAALHEAQSALSPLEHLVGGALASGWHLFSGVLHDAWAILGPVVHLLEDMKGPLSAIAVLAAGAWVGFKGATMVGLLLSNLINWVRGIPAAMTAMVASARESAAGYMTSMSSIGTSSAAAATTSTAAMGAIADESALMSGAIVADGEAAAVGWAGLLGPLGAVAVGVGLLVTMFHSSSHASKEAASAAKSYTDALKSGDPAELTDSIVKQLTDNDVPKKIAELNKAIGSSFDAKTFASAIQAGGQPLANLKDQLQGVIDANNKIMNQMGKQHGRGGPNQAFVDARNNANKAKALLSDLQVQSDALTKDQIKDIANYKALGTVAVTVDQVASKLHLPSAEVKAYAAMLGLAVTSAGDLVDATDANQQSILKVARAYDTATASGAAFLDAWQTFAKSDGTAGDRAALIGATLKAANGDALAFISTMANAQAASDALGQAFADQADQLDQESTAQKDAAAAVVAAQKRVNEVKADAHHKDSTLASAENSLGNAQQSAAKQGVLAYGDTEKAALKFSTGLHGVITASIDYTKKGAPALIQQLQAIQDAAMQAAEGQYQHEVATKGAKIAAADAYQTYLAQTQGALVDQAKKLGITTKQAQALATAYFGMPADVKTTIESEGTDPIVTVLNKIGKLLADFTGQPWDVNTKPAVQKVDDLNTKMDKLAELKATPYVSIEDRATAVLDGILNRLGAIKGAQVVAKMSELGDIHGQAYASGGDVNGPGTGTSDSIRARLSKGEFVENARAAAKFGPILEAINSGAIGSMGDLAALTGGGTPNGLGRIGGGPKFEKHQPITVVVQNPLPERASESVPKAILRATARLDGH